MLVESHQLKHNNKVKLVGALIADFEQVDTNQDHLSIVITQIQVISIIDYTI